MIDPEVLKNTMMFSGMSSTEISNALKGLRAYEKTFSKDETLLHAGDPTQKMGLVLEGSVLIASNDMWGNRGILSHVGPMQFFAETYALLPDEPLLVDVVANEPCRILFFFIGDADLSIGNSSWKNKILHNLLLISMRKNLELSKRGFHTSPKTIRGRVMSYLNTIALQKGSKTFEIPFDRQQLADYLNLDRSALSKELGKMQQDGLIRVYKNHFEIL